MDEQNNIIELIDEEGEAVQFELLATLEHEGAYYIALTLMEEDEESEESEVVFMKVEKDGEDEVYVAVDDEALQETLFEAFMQLMEQQEDDEE